MKVGAGMKRVQAWRQLATVAGVFLIFFWHAGWPVPDNNEAHYLGKLRHAWDPAYAAKDFFFNTADAHFVFTWCFGWVTVLLPLPVAAWCGRILIWIFLAGAFARLARTLGVEGIRCLFAAALFTALMERAHLAGEWVVGGVEAKGVAYAFVFLALDGALRRRWKSALVFLGLATTFHVLVGGWALVAAAWTYLGSMDRARWKSLIPWVILSLVLALPGVIPAALLSVGVSRPDAQLADQIIVFDRLHHHLSPRDFKAEALARFGVLLAVWWIVLRSAKTDSIRGRLRRFSQASFFMLLFGFVYGLLTFGDLQVSAALLKFYWFRLADAVIPLTVSLIVARYLRPPNFNRLSLAAAAKGLLVGCAGGIIVYHFYDLSLTRIKSPNPRTDRADRIVNYKGWCDACQWIRENTPADSVFMTPRLNQSFKWRTGRAEVGTWKDVPQDAKGLLQWKERMLDLHGYPLVQGDDWWYESMSQIEETRLLATARKYGADYLLALSDPPKKLPIEYSNGVYTVYRMRRAETPRD